MSRDVHSCTHWLRPRNSLRIWTRITRALLVSKDRRHLFVTPCSQPINTFVYAPHVLHLQQHPRSLDRKGSEVKVSPGPQGLQIELKVARACRREVLFLLTPKFQPVGTVSKISTLLKRLERFSKQPQEQLLYTGKTVARSEWLFTVLRKGKFGRMQDVGATDCLRQELFHGG